MKGTTIVILAAGQGTRMKSRLPKVLHQLCGRQLILWPVQAGLEAKAESVVVVDSPDRLLAEYLPAGVKHVVQTNTPGTAGAVLAAKDQLKSDRVIVLAGDVPLITPELIRSLAKYHTSTGEAATMVSMVLDDPRGYGRVQRGPDGLVEQVIETKEPGDATPQQLEIKEVNTGIFAFNTDALLEALSQVKPHNAQNEHYLPDVLSILRQQGKAVAALPIEDQAQALGINTRADLAKVARIAKERIQERHMLAGVTIIDPNNTRIDVDVQIGQDTLIEPFCSLQGQTTIGVACQIGPMSTLIDAKLGDEVTVKHSFLDSCQVDVGSTVGPFSYLRPGAHLLANSKAGAFVEIKNSKVGPSAKVPHLSYIGDAEVGEGTNLGAGTITANYDGQSKHKTKIGKRVRGGVDTSFVAPVSVGDDAYTAAGSVITEDVPPGSLGIARQRQSNIADYASKRR